MSSPIVLKDVRIIFRNFAGKEGKYNPAGDRNFSVLLDEKLAGEMRELGFNVKPLKSRDPDEDPMYHMKVRVSYRRVPPRIVMISGNSRVPLDEDTVGSIDFAEIERCDLTLNEYHWENNGRSGVSAYLRSAYITVVYDELDAMYMEEPPSDEDIF